MTLNFAGIHCYINIYIAIVTSRSLLFPIPLARPEVKHGVWQGRQPPVRPSGPVVQMQQHGCVLLQTQSQGWCGRQRWHDYGHERERGRGHRRGTERRCARMKGKPSWQLLLIGQSRFPADQTHMQCRLKEGSGPQAK